MKKLLNLMLLLFMVNSLKAQYTITPVKDTEICPNKQMTFTVSVDGKNPKINYGINSPEIIKSAYDISYDANTKKTTFKFDGRFNDINVSQTFNLNCINPKGRDTTLFISFNKIKSLFYGTKDIALVSPNIRTINAPGCQVNTYNISFSNLKWFTQFEQPAMEFGEIKDYEYLLPAGWKLGNTLSNGNNWISANNSVSISSDAQSGHGGLSLSTFIHNLLFIHLQA